MQQDIRWYRNIEVKLHHKLEPDSTSRLLFPLVLVLRLSSRRHPIGRLAMGMRSLCTGERFLLRIDESDFTSSQRHRFGVPYEAYADPLDQDIGRFVEKR